MTGDERARERAGEEDETWQGKERGRSDVRDLGNTKGILEHTRRTGRLFSPKRLRSISYKVTKTTTQQMYPDSVRM